MIEPRHKKLCLRGFVGYIEKDADIETTAVYYP